MNWKNGHKPEFHLYDSGERIETIDISDMTVKDLHHLLTSKGFQQAVKEEDPVVAVPNDETAFGL